MVVPFLDRCIFQAVSAGAGDFVQSTYVTGYQTIQSSGGIDGQEYHYAAQTTDLSQWEVGKGVWTLGTTTLSRVEVLYNSSGTGTAVGQSGAGTKIIFASAPQVMVAVFREDFESLAVPASNSGTRLWTKRRAVSTAVAISASRWRIV